MSDIKDGLGHIYKVFDTELSLSSKNVAHDYLDGFIEQFHPDNGEFGIDDWTAIDFLEWLKLNKFKVIK